MRRLLLALLVAALAVPAGATATPSVKTTRLPNLPFGLDLVPAATRVTTIAVVRHGRAQIAYRLAGRHWRRIGRVHTGEILVDGSEVCVGAFTSHNGGRTFSRSAACEAVPPDPAVVATVLHAGRGYRALSDLNAVLVTEPGQAVAVDEIEHVQFHATRPAFAWTSENAVAGLAVSGAPAEIAFGEAAAGDLVVHRTVDEGVTWLSGATLVGGVGFLPDARVARRLYAPVSIPGGVFGVARSTDAGTSWQPPVRLEAGRFQSFTFDVDAARTGRIAVTTDAIYVSDNGGASFRRFGPYRSEIDPARADRFGDWFLVRAGSRVVRRVTVRG